MPTRPRAGSSSPRPAKTVRAGGVGGGPAGDRRLTPGTVQAQKIIAATPMPPSLEKQILADLRDAAGKGFQIDFEQLSANLARLTAARA